MNVHQLLDLVSTTRLQRSITKTNLGPFLTVAKNFIEQKVKPVVDENIDPTNKQKLDVIKYENKDQIDLKKEKKQPIVRLRKSDVKLDLVSKSSTTIQLVSGGNKKKLPHKEPQSHVKLSQVNVRLSQARIKLSQGHVKLSRGTVKVSQSYIKNSQGSVQRSRGSTKLSQANGKLSQRHIKLRQCNIKLRQGQVIRPLTRSKASGKMSLRSRNIRTFVSSAPAKSAQKSSAVKIPSPSATKHLKIDLKPETITARILRNRSAKPKVLPIKRSAISVNKKITTFRPLKRTKMNTPTNMSEFSSEDETPLKFFPKSNVTPTALHESDVSPSVYSSETTPNCSTSEASEETPSKRRKVSSTGSQPNLTLNDNNEMAVEPQELCLRVTRKNTVSSADTDGMSTSKDLVCENEKNKKDIIATSAESIACLVEPTPESSGWCEDSPNKFTGDELLLNNLFDPYIPLPTLRAEDLKFLETRPDTEQSSYDHILTKLDNQYKEETEVHVDVPSKVSEENKNGIYEFTGENDPPPIVDFQTAKRQNTTTKSYYNVSGENNFVIEENAVMVPGIGTQLHCKLVLRKNIDSEKVFTHPHDFNITSASVHVPKSTVTCRTKIVTGADKCRTATRATFTPTSAHIAREITEDNSKTVNSLKSEYNLDLYTPLERLNSGQSGKGIPKINSKPSKISEASNEFKSGESDKGMLKIKHVSSKTLEATNGLEPGESDKGMTKLEDVHSNITDAAKGLKPGETVKGVPKIKEGFSKCDLLKLSPQSTLQSDNPEETVKQNAHAVEIKTINRDKTLSARKYSLASKSVPVKFGPLVQPASASKLKPGMKNLRGSSSALEMKNERKTTAVKSSKSDNSVVMKHVQSPNLGPSLKVDTPVKTRSGCRQIPSTSKQSLATNLTPVVTVEPMNTKTKATECNDSKPGCSSEPANNLSKVQTPIAQGKIIENLKCDNHTDFPKKNETPSIVEAPVYRPTVEQFQDPLRYIESILPHASHFGLCKIVPPTGKADLNTFHLPGEVKFTASNQYLNRMYQRWGPATQELCAMRKYADMQGVRFDRPPLIDGVELNFPELYKAVQDNGGLTQVMERGKWQNVANQMKLNYGKKSSKLLDSYYVKFLLAYDTCSESERQQVHALVERMWTRKYKKMVARAQSPTHRQRRLLRVSASSDSDDEIEHALYESEECVVRGRNMTINYFQTVAEYIYQMYQPGPGKLLRPEEVESEYWNLVLTRTKHMCVYAAAVDSGEQSLGWPRAGRNQPPWNLKTLSDNKSSVLRSLGPVLGLTVPTIHLGMLFSTSCWNRDPHGLPWIEYHHTGASKIWYGIPEAYSEAFRNAVKKLAPSFCLNKNIWLPSDVTMLPPSLLMENGVALSRIVQEPGDIIVVFPKAYTSSICTGYSVSESVYFGPQDWLATCLQEFKEAKESCEPTMFPLEQLLMAIATDQRASSSVLLQAYCILKTLLDEEKVNRDKLINECQVKVVNKKDLKLKKRHYRTEPEECDVCRTSLYLSKVTGLSGKNGAVCCKHAAAVIEVRQRRRISIVEEVLLICNFPTEQLDKALVQLEARIFPS